MGQMVLQRRVWSAGLEVVSCNTLVFSGPFSPRGNQNLISTGCSVL